MPPQRCCSFVIALSATIFFLSLLRGTWLAHTQAHVVPVLRQFAPASDTRRPTTACLRGALFTPCDIAEFIMFRLQQLPASLLLRRLMLLSCCYLLLSAAPVGSNEQALVNQIALGRSLFNGISDVQSLGMSVRLSMHLLSRVFSKRWLLID